MRRNWSEPAVDGTRWTIAAVAMLVITTEALSAPQAAVKADDSLRGKGLFEKRCGGCHGLDNDKEGPRLRTVFSRPAGLISSFKYSDAFKTAHITWNAESLEKWLTDPEKVIPDNDMAFHLEKADERRDVIAYLKELSGK